MKKIFQHIIMVIVFISFWSCAGEASYDMAASKYEATTETAKEEIDYNLDFNSLSKEQLSVYELRAKQKVKDFFDYLKIVSNPDVEKDFKIHSLELTKNLFINDTIKVFNKTLPNYLDSLQNSNYQVIFIPKKIKFTRKFEQDSTQNYVAILQSKLFINRKKQISNIDVYLVEFEKEFGETTQKTIAVKLGNIY